jgi:hypothetical protein
MINILFFIYIIIIIIIIIIIYIYINNIPAAFQAIARTVDHE